MTDLEEVHDHPGAGAGIRLFIKRDDLIHPDIQGNKWRKMQPALEAFARGQYAGMLSFGGAFSNHLQALGVAGRVFNIPMAAIIRGHAADLNNPTLAEAQANGMHLHSVSKKAYDFGIGHPEVDQIVAQYANYILLPEGGSTPEAVRSCRNISVEICQMMCPDIVAAPVGSGGTAAGILLGLEGQSHLLLFPSIERGVDHHTLQRHWPEPLPGNFTVVSGYDFGGFARWTTELIDFVRTFKAQTGILLDPIYTAKMMFGLYDMLKKDQFAPNSNIVAVHTGGLQAWNGFRFRFGVEI